MKFDFDKEKFKHICKKVFVLPIWIIIVSAIISTTMLLGIFLNGLQEHPVAYAVYVISAYALSVTVVACVIHGPGTYKSLKKKVYDNPVGNRYMTDVSFKVTISLYVSLAINTIYSVFKFAAGLYYSSGWWGAIAIYYMVLSLMRFFLLRYIRKGNRNLIEEFKCYRLCGAMMILLNLTLSGIVFQMIWQGKANIYHEIIIIASATYTFYTVTVSIIDLIKYHKYKSPVISATKAIRFAAALVSLLSLETAMLATYGTADSETFRFVITIITGTAICLAVIAISIFMLIRSNREIKKLKEKNHKENKYG